MREVPMDLRPPAKYTGRTQRASWYVGIVVGLGLVLGAVLAVVVGAVAALLWITS